MIVHWHGWGYWVGLLFSFWIFATVVTVVAAAPYIPDKHEAAITVQWGAAAIFALYGFSVQAVVEIRRRNPAMVRDERGLQPILHSDQFIGVKLIYWPGILLVVALCLAILAYMGDEISDGGWSSYFL